MAEKHMTVTLVIYHVIGFVAMLWCVVTVSQFASYVSTQHTQTTLTVIVARPNISDEAYTAYLNGRVTVMTEAELMQMEARLTEAQVAAELWQWIRLTLWNLLLFGIFVLQHSLMATGWWKDLLAELNLSVMQRTIYILATTGCLQNLMRHWYALPGFPLWYIDTSERTLLCLFFFLVYCVAWLLIYAASLTMDFPELVGIKQIYYSYLGLEPPMTLKSHPTQRLYGHMRHAGATCLLVVLWFHPMMTAARLLLATCITLYLFCGFSVKHADYLYLREQVIRKQMTVTVQWETLS